MSLSSNESQEGGQEAVQEKTGAKRTVIDLQSARQHLNLMQAMYLYSYLKVFLTCCASMLRLSGA